MDINIQFHKKQPPHLRCQSLKDKIKPIYKQWNLTKKENREGN